MKKFLVILIFSVLGTGGWLAYREHMRSLSSSDADTIVLYGNVEIRRVNLGFRIGGRIASVVHEEGDFVAAGNVMATLDQTPSEENLAAAVAQVDRVTAQLERLENGSRPQEIDQAKAALEEAEAVLVLAETTFRRDEQLVGKLAISEGDFDVARSNRDAAAARVRQCRQTLSLLVEGPRPEDIAAARAQLAEAQALRKRAETTLADTELMCPNAGILLTRVEEPGAVVQPGQTVAVLSLKDAVWVYVYIPETELGRIHPGQRVEIHTDSHEEPYGGQVGNISPEAEFTPKNVETLTLRTDLVYRVRIIADAPANGLRQGMPVTVRIPKKVDA